MNEEEFEGGLHIVSKERKIMCSWALKLIFFHWFWTEIPNSLTCLCFFKNY